RVTRGTRKSTVATVTEVAQYLRLLYARVGVQHSPVTGEPVQTATPAALAKRLEEMVADAPKRGQLRLAAPIIRGRKGHHEPVANWARDHGISELRCDGVIVAVEKFRKLDRYREHDVEALLHLDSGDAAEARAEVLRDALRLGKGACLLIDGNGKERGWLATERTDPATGEAFPELDPKHFSWNSARGWCPHCRGYGVLEEWMQDREDFAHLGPVTEPFVCPECHGTRLNRIARAVRIPVKAKAQGLFSGARADSISLPELLALPPGEVLAICGQFKVDRRGKAIVAEIEPEIRERLQFLDKVGLGYLTLDRASATLSGGEAQRIRLAAQLGTNLAGVLYVLDEPSIGLHARDNEALIATLHDLRDKGNTLLVVEHDADTMRAGDHIIDLGPGAGIHGGRLLAEGTFDEISRNEYSLTGKYLRAETKHPLRGAYRDLPKAWTPRSKRKEPDWLVLRGAKLRNLRGHDLMLPLGRLVMVGGVSGAGKSTLLRDCLLPTVQVARDRQAARLLPSQSGLAVPFTDLHNGHVFRSVVEVEQDPIGKTPRSTPATYIGAFDIIRDFFATLPEAKMHGYTAGTFSFNTKGGRCEECKGAGRMKIEMQFLPDSYVPCEACGGRRYAAEVDEIKWNGQSIADVLKMDFAAAAEFFSFHSRLSEMLGLMVETGLGYLELGQSSPTLSGGEAQRLKLVGELISGLPSFKEKTRGDFRTNLYLLEEPTIGLHMADVERLTHLLHRLVDLGHTVVVIEHSLELLAEADWLVEIGPEGGAAGGEILFQGPAAELKACKRSRTWRFLQPMV
ncbi:MAG: excinuclease ABC subunit A, partial [Opitutales bacterium]